MVFLGLITLCLFLVIIGLAIGIYFFWVNQEESNKN